MRFLPPLLSAPPMLPHLDLAGNGELELDGEVIAVRARKGSVWAAPAAILAGLAAGVGVIPLVGAIGRGPWVKLAGLAGALLALGVGYCGYRFLRTHLPGPRAEGRLPRGALRVTFASRKRVDIESYAHPLEGHFACAPADSASENLLAEAFGTGTGTF